MTTPQTESPEIAKSLGVPRIFFKREDLHPYGSHKGRSIPRMIDMKIEKGARNFVITGSGNAALAAVRHINSLNLKDGGVTLSILTGKNINVDKRAALTAEIKDGRVSVVEVPDPLRELFHETHTGGKTSLRQSTDDDALAGYETLATEIAETPDLSAVFVGASSGTTAQALADYFNKNKIDVQVHIVQTTTTSPLSREFVSSESEAETSLADAIVDKTAYRKDSLVKAVRKGSGSGWIATNDLIVSAQKLLKEKAGIIATANGALGLAGLIKALSKDVKFTGSVVCIITGR